MLRAAPFILSCMVVAGSSGGNDAAEAGSTFTTVYRFAGPPDGAEPLGAALIDVNGILYGTTSAGGSGGYGAVFSVSPSGMESVLHSFQNTAGQQPHAGLTDVDGVLYGTNSRGGNGVPTGNVFAITTSGSERVVHAFGVPPDGAFPAAPVTEFQGTLYGTTAGGGAFGDGTVYAINASGSETVLHSFTNGADGGRPMSGLIRANGTLFGATTGGGLNQNACGEGCGTVFTISPAGHETVIYRFKGGADGEAPQGLVFVDGAFYGAGGAGGIGYGAGTIFEIDASGKERVLYRFGKNGPRDGDGPTGDLVALHGALYGTTELGGAFGDGTIYSLDLSTGVERVVYSFAGGTDGSLPSAGLANMNGTLYGTTSFGGLSSCGVGCGTVFAITP